MMFKTWIPKLITAFLLQFSASYAFAAGFFFMNAEFGGDTLVNITYTDGSTADIDAGRGVSFGGGINVGLTDSLEVSASGAWKFTTTPQASNGDLTFTRIPLEAMLHLNTGDMRIGAGMTYHLANSLSGSGVAASLSQDFDNAFGFVAQVEFSTSTKLSYSIRYTSIEYQPSDGGPTADGSNIGIGLSFYTE